REKASAALCALKHHAYPAVVAACKSSDLEVSRRADEIARHIKMKVDRTILMARPDDVVITTDSKIVGQIALSSFKVQTTQFGEQQLRLYDMRTVSTK